MSVILKPHKILKTGRNESRFYLGDCVDVFKQLEPHSVDVIVTSPPYNIGIQYSRYQDALSAAEYLAWHTVLRELEAGEAPIKSAGNERGSRDCRVKRKTLWGPSGRKKNWRC